MISFGKAFDNIGIMRIDAARQKMEAGSARRIKSSLFMAVRTVDPIGHGIDAGLASMSAKIC